MPKDPKPAASTIAFAIVRCFAVTEPDGTQHYFTPASDVAHAASVMSDDDIQARLESGVLELVEVPATTPSVE